MTLQQLFETSATRLIAQGARSMNDEKDACLYHNSETGLMCAVGLLFKDQPDILEEIKYEGKSSASVVTMLEGCKLAREYLGFSYDEGNCWASLYDEQPDEIHLLNDLQAIHDEITNVSEWPKRLRYLGEIHHLNTEFLNAYITTEAI